MKTEDVKLGIRVEDALTGFTGMVSSRYYSEAGFIQFSVTPRATDETKYPERVFLDAAQLIYKDEGISADLPPQQPFPPGFVMGAVVCHNSSNFKGKIHGMVNELNGCACVAVTAVELKDGKILQDYFNVNAVHLETPHVAPSVTQTPPPPPKRSHDGAAPMKLGSPRL